MAENDTNSTVDASTDDLDSFENLWSGKAQETPKPEDNAENEAEIDESDAQNAEEESDDADDNNAEDSSATDNDDDSSDEEDKTPPKKKNTVQERIDELTKARREAEREADKWKAIAEERERSQSKKNEEQDTKETTPETKVEAPDHTNKDKYPLGDLDPKYQQDMIDYKLELRLSELDAKRETQSKEQAEQARREAIVQEWDGKLAAAQETYEDYRETVESLDSAFEGIDPQHGQFLAETVMRMDKGADVLYHLAKNPDQVQSLIEADPVNAALALGRLEASFAEPTPKAKVKESKAPTPPKTNTRGNAASLSVKPDTDDLDAFENVFFDKK